MVFALPALLVVLASGIGLGFWGGYWGRLWIWVALGLLIGIAVSMGFLGTAHYQRMRRQAKLDAATGTLSDELAGLLASRRPFLLAAIGGGGLVTILWLMAFKPF
jgi:ABC-type multidrug transport system permease subunit